MKKQIIELNNLNPVWLVLGTVAFVGIYFVLLIIFQWAWNLVAPSISFIEPINLWQAFAIQILSMLIRGIKTK